MMVGRLQGHFSRLELQNQSLHRETAPHTLSSLTLNLPPGIQNVYYYDLIGNVSTSHLRLAPTHPLNTRFNRYRLFEFQPRYPLLGGWNYSFTLGWDAPLAHSARWDKQNRRYIVGIPVLTA